MLSLFFSAIVTGAVVYAAIHVHRVYLKGHGRLYLVRLKDGGSVVVGPRVHRRLFSAGLVEVSEAI
jgi:hypothetical protein